MAHKIWVFTTLGRTILTRAWRLRFIFVSLDWNFFQRNTSALQAFLIQDNNKTEALVDENKTTCPEMYSLSQNNKLCYFLAKIRIVGYDAYDAYETLLVNKTMAVEFCNFFSNGTLPYGEFLLFKDFLYFQFHCQIKSNWEYYNQKRCQQ